MAMNLGSLRRERQRNHIAFLPQFVTIIIDIIRLIFRSRIDRCGQNAVRSRLYLSH